MIRTILQLFWTYLKIGAFTVGGGYVMLTYVQREVVEKRHWIEQKEFLNMLALAQAAPGVIAVNTAIFVGWGVGKHLSSSPWVTVLTITAAVLGAVLPSFVIILLIAIYFTSYKNLPAIEAIFKGVRPAVVALISATVVHLARKI